MLCPKCGKENVEEAAFCSLCGTPMGQPVAVRPRTSGMAIVSLVIGVVGLLTLVLPILVAAPLAIIAIVQINRSGGRLRGKEIAIATLCLAGVALFVIPVMAAMVFPVFHQARASARKAGCLVNAKQLGMAVQMYLTDWDAFPEGDAWCDTLEEYGVDRRTYRCPSAPGKDSAFAYNSYLSGRSPLEVTDPRRLVAIFESDRRWNAAGGEDFLPAEPRHLGGDNYAFADGHAKWFARGETGSQVEWTARPETGY